MPDCAKISLKKAAFPEQSTYNDNSVDLLSDQDLPQLVCIRRIISRLLEHNILSGPIGISCWVRMKRWVDLAKHVRFSDIQKSRGGRCERTARSDLWMARLEVDASEDLKRVRSFGMNSIDPAGYGVDELLSVVGGLYARYEAIDQV